MKILWYSNAPHASTGYGVQTKHVIESLQQLGHEIALAPNFGLAGGYVESNGIAVYPIYRDRFGQDILAEHAAHFKADLVVTLYDLWPFNVDFAARLKRPWAAWFPQDSYPPCPTVVEQAKRADYPIAISHFGLNSMAEKGVRCHYIPHGCDSFTYQPMDKMECRRHLQIPEDKFVVLMVAANQSYPSRKAFPENLAAFKMFHEEHPNSLLHLHTTMKPRGQMVDGVELDQLIENLGIGNAVRFTHEYPLAMGLSEREMAKIYNAADVLLSASMGEGFGVPIIEAQSCGTPVITTQFSSMPELTFNGLTVPVVQMFYTPLNTWQAIPSIDGIAEALHKIHARTLVEIREQSEKGRQAVVRDYSWPVITECWRSFLNNIEQGKPVDAEQTYHHIIREIPIDVVDDKLSFTTGCVASELRVDAYGLDKIEFEPGDVILDIGGHVGTFAIYCAKNWPQVEVHSFEPAAENWQRFERNLKAAGVRNVILHTFGVTSDGREITLSIDRANTGGTTEFVNSNGHKTEKAPTLTLDEIFEMLKLERVKLLKIDAEGAEHEILKTARCLDRIEYLSGEFHNNTRLEKQGHSIPELYQHVRKFLPANRITYSSCQMSE